MIANCWLLALHSHFENVDEITFLFQNYRNQTVQDLFNLLEKKKVTDHSFTVKFDIFAQLFLDTLFAPEQQVLKYNLKKNTLFVLKSL